MLYSDEIKLTNCKLSTVLGHGCIDLQSAQMNGQIRIQRTLRGLGATKRFHSQANRKGTS